MIARWYRNLLGRFVFRKLTAGIGILLLLVFVLIGLVTYNRFYALLENREQELLEARTGNLRDELANMIAQFKREAVSFYPLNSSTPGMYTYFLPERVPATERDLIEERKYMTGQQSYMLERNPFAMSVVMYRKADGGAFHKSRYPSAKLAPGFDLEGLFDSLPRTYTYPFIVRADGLYHNIRRPVVYFINPLFDFSDIRNDNVQGYFMMGVDSNTLIGRFRPEQDDDSRVVVRQNGRTLLDSGPDETGREGSGFLQAVSFLPEYGLEVTGMADTKNIQAELAQISWLLVALLLGIWASCVFMIRYILGFVTRRLRSMTQHFKRMEANPFVEPLETSGDDEISDLIHRFNRMTRELQDYINRVYIADAQRSHAEYLALKMQINPHFLYNTLESLRMQAVVNRQPDMADKLFTLGRLYRWLLKSDCEEIPVEEELRYTRYYLDLLMMGKPKQIELEAESEADLYDCTMPKFSLQPIVENAILHGELEKAERPVILVRIRLDEDAQWIEIANNGKGIAREDQLKLNEKLQAKQLFGQEHLGLKNVHERIRSLYGEPFGLRIKPTRPEDGFALLMKLPRDAYDKGGGEYAENADRR
ncbi:histidine kinase [Paenibacillus cisolokensis]|uniref:sensor histidine kinase n=1 Tax=Paenibacillus cisolokensis TaxID=1658519 RepID=UPI003D2D0C51